MKPMSRRLRILCGPEKHEHTIEVGIDEDGDAYVELEGHDIGNLEKEFLVDSMRERGDGLSCLDVIREINGELRDPRRMILAREIDHIHSPTTADDVALFTRAGADVDRYRSYSDKMSLANVYSYAGKPKLLKALVKEHPGVDLDSPDGYGDTPLHNAVLEGNENIILYLLTNGADPTIKNKKGQMPYDFISGFYLPQDFITEETIEELKRYTVRWQLEKK